MKQMTIRETNFPELKLASRGKVRDIYDLGKYLLLVATDRISAFDVVMNEPVPYKGYVLTQISRFWFGKFGDIVPTHYITATPEEYSSECRSYIPDLAGRSMLVKKCEVLPVECIVRGYLSGSAWKDYQLTGAVCGQELSKGLRESDKLPLAIFTPSTKADQGLHDENIPFTEMVKLIGLKLAERARQASWNLYRHASAWAEPRSIIIADTKFEFGLDEDGELTLIDEVLTPDSSRFWPEDDYEPGRPQKSYDKQYLRDYLESLGWNKKPPPPPLPMEVIWQTSVKYREALLKLTGEFIN